MVSASVGGLLEDLVNTVIYSTIVKGFTMSRQHDQATRVVLCVSCPEESMKQNQHEST